MSRITQDLANSAHHHHHYYQYAGAGKLLGCDSDGNKNNQMRAFSKLAFKMPNIAVVGAGMAGLRCAEVLSRNGAQVTMFEARDRVGGRVHQIESAGRLMDMGANWIHGTYKNPIMDMAKQTGTVVYDPEVEGGAAVWDAEGKRIDDREAGRMLGALWETIARGFQYSDENSGSIDPQRSLLDYFKDELPKHEKDPVKVEQILQLAYMWGPFVGDPVYRQSLKFFFLEECIEGNTVFVAGTYEKILKSLASSALKNVQIHYNTEIVHFAPNEDEHSVTITTAAAAQHTFDEVIITCPLGWLKRNKATAFSKSPLSPELSQAIENVGYGRLEKIYVTFPSAFWLSSSSSSSSSDGLVGPFAHFLEPNYISQPHALPWDQSVMSLAQLPSSSKHPTLLFYIYGPCATAVVSGLKDVPPNSAEYDDLLNTFTQPFYSRLPNYSSTSSECKPVAFLATQWQNDPFAGHGSYTNVPVGSTRADRDIEVMRAGMGETAGIWLAGEHTAPFIALGTTTGAYWSGEGVARRICAKWAIEMNNDEYGLVGQQSEITMKKDVANGRADVANLHGVAL